MNHLKLFLIAAVVALSFFSCKKETGPAGADGNANVKAFIFTNPITNGSYWSDTLPGIADLESSLLLAYIQDNTCGSSWLSVPGFDCLGTYTTNLYSNSAANITTVSLEVRDANGSPTTETITKLRIIVAPANSVFSGKKELDVKDYREVCRYYGIKE